MGIVVTVLEFIVRVFDLISADQQAMALLTTIEKDLTGSGTTQPPAVAASTAFNRTPAQSTAPDPRVQAHNTGG